MYRLTRVHIYTWQLLYIGDMSNTNMNYLYKHSINEQYIMYIQWVVGDIHKHSLLNLIGLIIHLLVY